MEIVSAEIAVICSSNFFGEKIMHNMKPCSEMWYHVCFYSNASSFLVLWCLTVIFLCKKVLVNI
jgi:hypothetical protein